MKIFIEGTAGEHYECELDADTPVGVLAADFFENMGWLEQDGMGRGQRAVVELILAPGFLGTKKNKRLKSELTLEQTGISDGSLLRIFPELIEDSDTVELGVYVIFLQPKKGDSASTTIPYHWPLGESARTVLANNFGAKEFEEKVAIISKRYGQLLPNHFDARRVGLTEGDTLIIGAEKHIFEMLPFLENLATMPNEIFMRGLTNAMGYLRSLINTREGKIGEAKSEQLNECKLVFIGEAEKGKTSLIKWLTTKTYSKTEPKTEKIVIKKWLRTTGTGRKIRFNIWDFGGQEIMHSVNQLFITSRSIYVLVTNPRTDTIFGVERELNYWLELICSFAPEAFIIVAIHKCETNTCDIGKGNLKDRFKQIIGFVETSCAKEIGRDELLNLIETGGEKLPYLKDELPSTFLEIKDRLEKISQDTIDYIEYIETCRSVDDKFSTTQAGILAALLHDLGSVLNYANTSYAKDILVLNPQWFISAIYGIINAPILIHKKGILSIHKMREMFKSIKYEKIEEQDFIIDLMCRFEQCFRTEQHYYFPAAFPKDRPNLPEAPFEKGLHFQYRYSILPPFIIGRFIVRNHRFLMPDFYWHNGCIIEDKEENLLALIESNSLENIISIKIVGKGNKRSLLSYIRKAFQEIHEKFPKITIDELVPLKEGDDSFFVEYGVLLIYQNEGRPTYFDHQSKQDYSVADLLGLVFDPYEQQKGAIKNKLSRIDEKMENLRGLLAQNELDEVFEELNNIPDLSSNVSDSLLILQARYNSIKQESMRGILDEGEGRKEINQIRYGLLNLIDKT